MANRDWIVVAVALTSITTGAGAFPLVRDYAAAAPRIETPKNAMDDDLLRVPEPRGARR